MVYFLVALAVWVLWSSLAEYFEANRLFWLLLPLVLGVGGQCLIDYHRWWLGFGLGGLAVMLMKVNDLLLVSTDWIRVAVLRQQRNSR
jgi:hypothetical protein